MNKIILFALLTVTVSHIAKANSWNELIFDDFSTYTDSLNEDIYSLGTYPANSSIILENNRIKCIPDTTNKMLYLAITRTSIDSTLPLKASADWATKYKTDEADAAFAVGLFSNTKGYLVGGIYPHKNSTEFRISFHSSDNKETILNSVTINQTDTAYSIAFEAYPDSLILRVTSKNNIDETLKTSWSDSLYFPEISINTQQSDTLSILYFDNLKLENIILPNNIIGTKKSNVNVFPTVTSDFINIEGIEIGDIVEIFSTNGKLVKKIKSNDTNNTIDITNLNNGMHIINITGHNSSYNGKIVIE